MAKPKILFITTWYSPRDAKVLSAGVFHYEQAMALKPYCDMALYYPYDEDDAVGLSKAKEHGLLTYRSVSKGSRAARAIACFRDSVKVIRDYKPDVIHAHVAAGAGLIGVVLGKLFRIPVVVTEHNPIELSHFERKSNRTLVGFVYRNTKANICVSADSARRLKEIFPKSSFHVIYNGIIDPTIDEKVPNYAKEGRINFSIVAAFYDKDIKGYQFLLPAVAALKKEGYPVLLHVCGGGPFLDYYKKMAKDLDIEDCVIFYGQCDKAKVYDILSQMSFSVSASIFECSGVSVQEAMLIGKPLVVTRSGGANSLVSDKTAIVTDRESIDALTDGIRRMIDERARFVDDEIRLYALKRFEIDQVSRKYLQLYQACLKGKRL